MSWKGNPTGTNRKGYEINPVPNAIQDNNNLSEVVSDYFQSEDTGDVITWNEIKSLDDPKIPKVAPYKKDAALRRDTDKVQNFSVNLLDIDSTILNYMNQRLDISVMDNGTLVKVPVLYASPERWKSVKQDGYLRDNQGKILLPAILIKRTGVENNKDLMTLNRYLSHNVVVKYDEKNKYDKFSTMMSKTPFKKRLPTQIFNVTLPDHVLVTYECILWTDYVDQNNKILEKINFATHDYWGLENFRFRTRVDSYTNTVELGAGEDRNVKTTFNLIVYAYLLPETIDGVKSTTVKTMTVRKIVLKDSVVDAEQLEKVKQQINYRTPYSYLKNIGSEYKNIDLETPEFPFLDDEEEVTVEKTPFRPVPKSSATYGEAGWLSYDDSYIYVYIKSKGWRRRAIAEFDFDPSTGTYISNVDSCGNVEYSTTYRPINTAFRVFQRFKDSFYHQVPYQSSDYGEDGWVSYDGNYFYIYSSGKWRRVPISLVDESF